jgi:hypothetical protein
MASVRLERDQHIIYVKHNFMLSGLKAGRTIFSAKEHKLILPISPKPYFCQKIFYLHSNFPALNFLLTKQNSENLSLFISAIILQLYSHLSLFSTQLNLLWVTLFFFFFFGCDVAYGMCLDIAKRVPLDIRGDSNYLA